MRVGVVIATLGRPLELGQLLARLRHQTQAPSKLVISATGPGDLPQGISSDTNVLFGSAGTSVQRNRGLAASLADCDLVAFLDDDYVPEDEALAGMSRLFQGHTDVVGANGLLLADGISSAGLSMDKAVGLLEAYIGAPKGPPKLLDDLQALYGCNMVFRTAAIGQNRFDETLPLYGWQEDFDFSARIRLRGRLVRSDAFAGVHRGVKGGRSSGLRFGYSQIANPLYLARKGTMSTGYAAKLMTKNLIANHLRSLRPEPWVDRWGRVRGNWLAFGDALSGRLHPQRITELI
jgi:GT2 family glycosyltransferase